MRKLIRAAVSAAAVTAVMLTAACGSDSAAGPAQPSEPVIDLSKLDTGNLETKPKQYGKAINLDQAKILEAERLANYLPLPSEIEPEVKYPANPWGSAVRPFIDFGSAAVKSRITADPGAMNAAAQGFVSGYLIAGQSDEELNLSYELENVVLIFTDEQAAAAAAPALGQTDLDADPQHHRVSIDKYPAAFAYVTDDPDHYAAGYLQSWYATGRYVVYTRVVDNVMDVLQTRDLPKLVAHVQHSIDAIAPAVAKFPATPQDKLADLPIDPDNVIGRAIYTVVDDPSEAGMPGVYDRQGGLQVVQGEDEIKLFDEAGVDRVAWKGGYVYRARDAAGAAKIVDQHSRLKRTYVRADSPQNLPNAVCRKYIGPTAGAMPYYCFVWHDRYAAEVWAGQLLDAQQRISAQYAMLVNAK
ncbi:DUF7373 family lipoprotein [Nocardia sp. CDC160]|uniref:DUF7373 family lipoprotein n=1 Tax=Nocardia sp. CDC160 TaxID=3112166 RepID=UPI002DBC88B2|nr:hypothetical protein [Nocardia sp. CDC160]MEC3913234.1 hypothetical protein [Nocardia sp. CDC160]